MDKVYWNKYKDNGMSIEVDSFATMLNFCLFYNDNSAIFISDRYHNKYFSPFDIEFNVIFIYKQKIKEVSVNIKVLLNKDYDMYLSLISCFKEVLSKDDLGHFINFVEKLKFWEKSKSRFVKELLIKNNEIKIEFNKISKKIEDIIFS